MGVEPAIDTVDGMREAMRQQIRTLGERRPDQRAWYGGRMIVAELVEGSMRIFDAGPLLGCSEIANSHIGTLTCSN